MHGWPLKPCVWMEDCMRWLEEDIEERALGNMDIEGKAR